MTPKGEKTQISNRSEEEKRNRNFDDVSRHNAESVKPRLKSKIEGMGRKGKEKVVRGEEN